nr:hypothetical protein [Tanacetum cinerariifolium]
EFWSFVSIKRSNDVVRLQAQIDRKKVIIKEDSIRQALRLDDSDGVDCLPNEDIFAELARMGYEKLSTKLTFYMAFFSAKWKFLIHTILQCMSAKRTAWNEFSSSMASAVICLATGMDTPLFDGMLVQQQAQDVKDAVEDENDDNEVRLPESQAKVYHLDLEHAEKVHSMQDTNEAEPAKVKEVIKVVIAAKLMTEVVTTVATTITVAQVPKASAPRRRRSSEEERKARQYSHEISSFKKETSTPLASKVPVVDYEIHHEHNKPYYKIIRADETHQLFISFITLLKNFDREDLEML